MVVVVVVMMMMIVAMMASGVGQLLLLARDAGVWMTLDCTRRLPHARLAGGQNLALVKQELLLLLLRMLVGPAG